MCNSIGFTICSQKIIRVMPISLFLLSNFISIILKEDIYYSSKKRIFKNEYMILYTALGVFITGLIVCVPVYAIEYLFEL